MLPADSKILIYSGTFFPSSIGGPAEILYYLAKELVKTNFDVKVITSNFAINKSITTNKWLNMDGFVIKYCKVGNNQNAPIILFNCIKEVKKRQVIMLNSLCQRLNFCIALYALLLNKKIIWSVRGELFDAAIDNNIVKKLYFNLIKRIFVRKNVVFHATSTEEANLITNRFGGKVNFITIPNYIEMPNKVEYDETNKYFLYVGRINKIKALDNLIEGHALSKKFIESDYQLYIAGKNEGEYYRYLLLLIKKLSLQNKIKFISVVEGAEKNKIFANAKASFLVSHSENFGNVVIESLAQGTPVVTSIYTPWSSLNGEGAGFWINNTPKSIAETIDYLLSLSDKDYKKMRDIAYNFCLRNFSITNNIQEWIEAIV